ncbi:MAG: hypothetical protein RL733_806 [Actinomycetota bacterium]
MFAFKSLAAKYSGALALVLAIFSAGIVVIHACHSEQAKHVSSPAHHDDVVKSGGEIIGSGTFGAKICAATFFLVLLVGRKYLIKSVKKLDLQINSQILRLRTTLHRPPGIKYALSLSQLGVIRI